MVLPATLSGVGYVIVDFGAMRRGRVQLSVECSTIRLPSTRDWRHSLKCGHLSKVWFLSSTLSLACCRASHHNIVGVKSRIRDIYKLMPDRLTFCRVSHTLGLSPTDGRSSPSSVITTTTDHFYHQRSLESTPYAQSHQPC